MKKLLLGVIAVLIVLACVLGFYYVFKSDDKPYDYSSESSSNSLDVSQDKQDLGYEDTASSSLPSMADSSASLPKAQENEPTNAPQKSINTPASTAQEPINEPAKQPTSKPVKPTLQAKVGKKDLPKIKPILASKESKSQKDVSKIFKPLKAKKQATLKKLGFTCNNYSSLIKEYQCKGKNSTYIPSLSDSFMHVYFENGILPSKYRLGVLKGLFKSIKQKSKDYNITIFVKMLPNLSMDFSIYNKDIIFANKAIYKYVYKNAKMGFKLDFAKNEASSFSGEKKLVSFIDTFKRDQVIKRVFIGTFTDLRGSNFANYLLGLKRSTSIAAYFFPLSEAIYMHSYGKSKHANRVQIKLEYK